MLARLHLLGRGITRPHYAATTTPTGRRRRRGRCCVAEQRELCSEAVRVHAASASPPLPIPSLKQRAGGAMKKSCFGFGGSRVAKRMSERAPTPDVCVFCDIARRAPTSTTSLLYAVPYLDHPRWHLRSSCHFWLCWLTTGSPSLCAG
jgi:hypothetical protein